MKKILVINGVNLNMLGIREQKLYGKQSLADLESLIKSYAHTVSMQVECFQSNFEGEIVEKIHSAYGKFDGIIINAGAYTHTSIAILDALSAVQIPTVEVHLTDIYNRESFRNNSFISLYAKKCITNQGFDGYLRAIDYFK